LLVETQYDDGAQQGLVMHGTVQIESFDKECNEALVCLVSGVTILAVSGRESQHRAQQDGTMLDEDGDPQRELAGGIGAVQPAAQILCIVVDEFSFMMAERDGVGSR
jgi:hypothetical protein